MSLKTAISRSFVKFYVFVFCYFFVFLFKSVTNKIRPVLKNSLFSRFIYILLCKNCLYIRQKLAYEHSKFNNNIQTLKLLIKLRKLNNVKIKKSNLLYIQIHTAGLELGTKLINSLIVKKCFNSLFFVFSSVLISHNSLLGKFYMSC